MEDVFNLEAWRQVVVSSLTQLGTTVAGFAPRLVGAALILLLGWVVAKLVEVVARRVLARIGLDHASGRLGISDSLSDIGIARLPSGMIARLLFWVLMLTFVLSAFETVGLRTVTGTIDRLIGYLPNVIAAALIVIVGLLIGQFTGNVVASGAATAGVGYARQLGGASRWAVILMVAVLAAEQLGLDTQILVTTVTAVLAAFSIGLALAFALGSRDIVRAILAGHYLRQSFADGERLEVDGRAGVLERIGAVDAVFHDDEARWSVPNARLLDAVVERRAEPQ